MAADAGVIEPTRIYQHHHLDSTRWRRLEHRPDDIVIDTAYKAGTTWMQTIVAHLVFRGGDWPDGLHEMSPWIDMRTRPLDEVLAGLEAQAHRRFLKCHLALDGVRFDPRVRYVIVARDGRDVFMSFLNHYSNYSPEMFELVNDLPGRVGPPLEPYDGDPHRLFHDWLTRGSFAWESDGHPFWSFFHHLGSWWSARRRSNVLLVHFADLLRDLDAEMRRVARFLDIPIEEDLWPAQVEGCTFASMKRDAERYAPRGGVAFKGGATTFIYKGTNDRWKELLDDAEVSLYERVARERLPADALRWLESGRSALAGDDRAAKP